MPVTWTPLVSTWTEHQAPSLSSSIQLVYFFPSKMNGNLHARLTASLVLHNVGDSERIATAGRGVYQVSNFVQQLANPVNKNAQAFKCKDVIFSNTLPFLCILPFDIYQSTSLLYLVNSTTKCLPNTLAYLCILQFDNYQTWKLPYSFEFYNSTSTKWDILLILVHFTIMSLPYFLCQNYLESNYRHSSHGWASNHCHHFR